jgi:peptidoglycan/xylan/chitin deacetylase (PgdA/CDA1 family)
MAFRSILSPALLAMRAPLLVLLAGWFGIVSAQDIPALVYHDIAETGTSDPFAVSREAFAEQLEYLRAEGYTPVSLSLLGKLQRGEAALPEKPVLITFDDGLASYATIARPLLERYGFPSVLSVVSGWADGQRVPPEYRGKLLDWDALRSLARTSGVELVSHTHDLHHGVPSNPQGNQAPASITRRFDAGSGRYESEEAFRARIRADLELARARFVAELKQPPTGVAWPFGLYDEVLVEEATRLGMKWQLTLDRAPTRAETLPRIHRLTFHRLRNLRQFADMVSLRALRREQVRFVEIDYDLLSPQDPARFEQRLSQLLRRLELLRVGGVVLRPFSADGKQAYFPTSTMPFAADTLNRVLHQLRSRLHLDHLYLRIPVEATTSAPAILAEDLGRLNRFSGVIVSDAREPSTGVFVRRLRYHQPTLRVGVLNGTVVTADAQFVLREITATSETDTVEREARKWLSRDSKAWFLVQRDAATEDQLRDALVALRRAGAAHFGYSPDDFVAARPRATDIVSTLLAHTVVRHVD